MRDNVKQNVRIGGQMGNFIIQPLNGKCGGVRAYVVAPFSLSSSLKG